MFVILANREYRVLKHNIDVYRQRFGIASQEPYAHMDLGRPRSASSRWRPAWASRARAVTRPSKSPPPSAAFASGKPHVVEVAIEAKR